MEWPIDKIGYIREQENESGLFNILKAKCDDKGVISSCYTVAVPFLNKYVK